MNRKKALEFFGYDSDPERSTLVIRLGEIAILWRGSKEEQYVQEYHKVYAQLKALGWIGHLDVDSELPKELMPKIKYL